MNYELKFLGRCLVAGAIILLVRSVAGNWTVESPTNDTPLGQTATFIADGMTHDETKKGDKGTCAMYKTDNPGGEIGVGAFIMSRGAEATSDGPGGWQTPGGQDLFSPATLTPAVWPENGLVFDVVLTITRSGQSEPDNHRFYDVEDDP